MNSQLDNWPSILIFIYFKKFAQSNSGTGHVAILVANPFIAKTKNRSTVFARWRQYKRPYNLWFLGLTPLIIPNSSSISSAVFAQSLRRYVASPHFPPNMPLTMKGTGPPSNQSFFYTTCSLPALFMATTDLLSYGLTSHLTTEAKGSKW